MIIEKTSIKDLLDKMLEIDNAWNSETPNNEFIHLFAERWKVYQQILEQQALRLKVNVGDIFVFLCRNLLIDVDEEKNIFEVIKVNNINSDRQIEYTSYEYKKKEIFAPIGSDRSVDYTYRLVVTNKTQDFLSFACKISKENFNRYTSEQADNLIEMGIKQKVHYCSELKDIEGTPLFTEEEYDMMREGLM